jgi:glycosyltransferase involved in cell wall biosynthesis
MGFAFTKNDTSNRLRFLISAIYSYLLTFVLNHPSLRVIVQNEDDFHSIISIGNLDPSKVILIPGSGVELQKFLHFKIEEKFPIVLLPARILWDKGVQEFIDAAKNLKLLMPEWRFILAGAADYNNPTCVPKSLLEELNTKNIIEWVGHLENIEPYFAKASIVCLPSYREGMPKCLLEGAAAGCAIVTTDAVGCREAILPDITGYLVPIANSNALTNALHTLMNNRELREQFGRSGRELAINKFSLNVVVNENLEIYREMLI